jgi:sterol 3beta-glucosyltransferase
MDEFYFSFFSRTREAFIKLQSCLNNAKSSNPPPEQQSEQPRGRRMVSNESTKFKDSVRDTTILIRASSPTAESFEASGGSSRHSLDKSRHSSGRNSVERSRPSSERHSMESLHRGDFMDDAEILDSGQHSPRRASVRAALRHLSMGLSGRRSPSPSPLRKSRTFSESFDRIDRPPHSGLPGGSSPQINDEASWSDAGKMLWSRGVNVADWMRQRSAEVGSQVGTMLASPATTLNAGVGKVSQLWNGDTGKSEHAKWITEETAKDMRDQNPEERFQSHFALPPMEKLLGAYYGYVFRTFPFYGKMYVSRRYFCFRSLLPGIKTKVFTKVYAC